MSRRIHRTRRDYDEAKERVYADAEERAAHLEQILEDLSTKRRIKGQVQAERRRGDEPLPPTAPETIPVQVREQGEYVQYPASVEDIRAVMCRLPAGVLDGLHSVELCLGLEDQQRGPERWVEEPDVDPFVGRLGVECWPGVYSGRVLGVCHRTPARIRLLAYLYDRDMPDRDLKELYLRLQMLSTFVHEVAHHYDFTVRVARGRWLADDVEKLEIYAENEQHEWVQACVIPYLEAAYPEEVQALAAWIARYGGISLSLALLAGDPRTSVAGNGIKLFFPIKGAFENLVTNVSKGEGSTATRIEFARELHFGENYAESLTILRGVLADHPEHPEALTLQADIAVHHEEYDLAEALCARALAVDETCLDAWHVLTDVHWERRDWDQILLTATRAVSLSEAGGYDWRRSLSNRARAHLELGNFEELHADIESLLADGSRASHWDAMTLRAMMWLRTGRTEEAFQIADAALLQTSERLRRYHSVELAAVRFEAAHVMGRPSDSGGLTVRDIRLLRHRGHEPWIDRLVIEHGLKPVDESAAP
jgi:tetratricopeptide (TPR) repeat protein